MSTTNSVNASSLEGNLRGLIKTMRLRQWTKNAFVSAGLVFDGKLLVPDLLLKTILVTFCFCLASSSVYLLNDLVDINKDREHPKKRLRPLPSGQLDPKFAAISAALLASTSLLTTFFLNPWVGAVIALYLIQNVAYSFYLKNIVIIDAMLVAFGFLLRVIAGVLIVDVANFSPWLYVTATVVALFMVFGKRRHEITLLSDGAGKHRESLKGYNLPMLDQIIGMVTTFTLVSYTFYTFESKTAMVEDSRMLLTVPFVFYGIVRYLYLIHVEKLGGAPDELILEDTHMLVNAILWAALVLILIYLI